MGLAGPWRPAEQQPALEVLAGPEEHLAVGGDPQRVPLDPAEHRLGQDDVGADQLRDLAEVEGDLAHLVQADVDQVPAIHVELVA